MKKLLVLIIGIAALLLFVKPGFSQSSDLDGKWVLYCGPNSFNVTITKGIGPMDEIGGNTKTKVKVEHVSGNKYKIIRTGEYNQTFYAWYWDFKGQGYMAGYMTNKKYDGDYPWHSEKKSDE